MSNFGQFQRMSTKTDFNIFCLTVKIQIKHPLNWMKPWWNMMNKPPPFEQHAGHVHPVLIPPLERPSFGRSSPVASSPSLVAAQLSPNIRSTMILLWYDVDLVWQSWWNFHDIVLKLVRYMILMTLWWYYHDDVDYILHILLHYDIVFCFYLLEVRPALQAKGKCPEWWTCTQWFACHCHLSWTNKNNGGFCHGKI